MQRLRAAGLTLLACLVLAWLFRLAAAPTGAWWLTIPALALAYAGIARSRPGVALRRGLLVGVCYILVGLAWVIVPATLHLGPPIAAVALVVGAFEAFPFFLTAWLAARATTARPLAFVLGAPALFALLETARTSGALGLPLPTIGATQTAGPLAVVLTYGGVPLATFVAGVFAAALAFAARGVAEPALRVRPLAIVAIAAIVVLVPARLEWRSAIAARGDRPKARIGFVSAGPIGVGKPFAETAARYARATTLLANAHVDYALWPEGVVFLVTPDAAAQRIAALTAARSLGRPLLAGVTYRERGLTRNVLLAIAPSGATHVLYTKRRLVPFGEYQPFGIGKSPDRPTYVAGAAEDNAAIRLPGLTPFGTLICYEVAFSDLTRASALGGAEYLVAALNDSWFAGTDGPAQLTQLVRARAIESGIPILRIDAVPPSGGIDVDGSWIAAPLEAEAAGVVAMPGGFTTPYRHYGPLPTLVVLALLTLTFVVPRSGPERVGGGGRARSGS